MSCVFFLTWTINGRQHGMYFTWTKGMVRCVNCGFSIRISALLLSYNFSNERTLILVWEKQ